MRIWFLLFFALPLWAVNLVSYSIYDTKDRVDLLLSFDGAYNGKISQKKQGSFSLLSFTDLKYPKSETKNLNSQVAKRILISPNGNDTNIMFENENDANISVSALENNKFALRIRAQLPKNDIISENIIQQETMPKPKESSLEGYDYTNYIIVMLVLVLMLIGLWWFKRTMMFKNSINIKDFNIIFQRALDRSNQFMILEYSNKRYVMIIGNSNLLLESYEISKDERINQHKESGFDSFFEENKRKIQDLIQAKKNKNI